MPIPSSIIRCFVMPDSFESTLGKRGRREEGREGGWPGQLQNARRKKYDGKGGREGGRSSEQTYLDDAGGG